MAHILLVDDSGMILRTLGNILRPLGHVVDFAQNASEAEDLLDGTVGPAHESPFDLIICDNNMRIRNEGIGFAKQLRLKNNVIPFILYTSSEASELPSDWKKSGVHYVSKLIRPSEFIKKVDELTSGS